MKKRLITLISIAVFLLSACQPKDENSIKIGVIAPLTGDAAAFGADIVNAIRQKTDEINASGGINEQQIELIIEDGRCTGSDAAGAAQKLIYVDKVVTIIGGVCSGETLAIAPIAETAKIVELSPTSSSPDVTDAGDFIFRNYPSDALKTKAMANYFRNKGFSKIAIITENTDFAIAFRNALEKDIGENAYVFDEIVEPGTKDFRTLMTRLKDVEFDAFVVNGQTPPTVAVMLQQMREQGIKGLAIGHDVADNVDVLSIAGESAEGLQAINVPNVDEKSDYGQSFIAKYGDPQVGLVYAAIAYDAMGVIANVIESVGTEGSAMRDYLYNLEGYDGVIGRFSFDKNGDVIGIPYALKEVKNGTFVKIADIEVE